MESEIQSIQKPDTQPLKPIIAVTGSQRPYIFDLPHLLSLPEGFEFRFRYRHKWVQPEIIRELSHNSEAFSGREVIVLFHSQDSHQIVPIRKGTIISLEELGPMILFRFRVGPFAKIDLDLLKYKYPSTPEEASASDASEVARNLYERTTQFLGMIDGKEKYDLSKSLPSGFYLREALNPLNPSDWDHNDVATAWARAVAVLHTDQELFGLPFFLLLGFRKENGETVKPSEIENRFSLTRESIHGFALQEQERYRMRILEWCERPQNTPDPRVRLNCDFQQAHLALEGASNLVVGRYDIVEFTFLAQQPGYSEVCIRSECLDKNNEKQEENKNDKEKVERNHSAMPAGTDWPTIFAARVPIVVKTKSRRFITAALTSAIGIILYIIVAPQFDSKWQNAVEIVALAFLYFGYSTFSEHVERFLKLRGGMNKLRSGDKGSLSKDDE